MLHRTHRTIESGVCISATSECIVSTLSTARLADAGRAAATWGALRPELEDKVAQDGGHERWRHAMHAVASNMESLTMVTLGEFHSSKDGR